MTETRYTAHPLYSINCRAMEACILFFLGQIESCPCIYNLHTQTSKNFFLTCTSAPESTLTTLCSFLLLWIQVNHWHYPDGCRVFPANLTRQQLNKVVKDRWQNWFSVMHNTKILSRIIQGLIWQMPVNVSPWLQIGRAFICKGRLNCTHAVDIINSVHQVQ